MKMLPRSLAALILAMLAIIFLATTARADDEKDPPGRVARLKYMSGQVSFQPGGVNDWVDATLNRPLTTADRVWTDKDSKAELQLDAGAIRMSSETSITLTNLTDNTVQVELDQGILNLHVRRMYPGEIYEVDTPNVAFTLLKPGDYRFEVDPNNDTTEVIVRKGKGEGNGDGRGVEVESGEMARFEHGNTLMHVIGRAPNPDGFDDWCRVRDKREDRSFESARYVSSDVIGYEDLDEYGYWRPVPTYGYVWMPRHVVVGWAPYRYGHWAWIDPWGWTWVDDAPWGFAPFHYGRWVYSPYGWGWCPGPRRYRPVYAPALVAWIGGRNWGIGFGFGNVGWVPLGWGEPYYPYYRASRGYVRNVNITNTHITNITYVTNNYNTIINNHGKPMPQPVRYMNARGVSVVPNDAMINSRRVDRHMRPFDGKDFHKAEFMGSPGVTPDRRSVLGPGNSVRAPQNFSDRRPVVSKLTPPGRPTSFEERRPFIEKNNGMPVGRTLNTEAARVPDARKPVSAGEGPGVPRGGNRADSATPAGPRTPAERQPANVGERSNGTGNGHVVPRPPVDRQPMGVGNESPAARGASNGGPTNGGPSNDSPRHVVPRPPTDRSPAVGNGNRNTGRDSNAPQAATPRVPEDRRPVNAGDGNGRFGGREANTNVPAERNASPNVPAERNARPSVPQDRPSAQPDRGRAANAESRPAPRPPQREVKPQQERKQAPSREEKPKPSERDSRSSNGSQSGYMARSGTSHYVPRPTASNPSRPASSYSNGGYANASYSRNNSYGRDSSYSRSYGQDRGSYGNNTYRGESGYSRGSYSRDNSYGRDYGYSGRSYGNSQRETRSSNVYRGTPNYSRGSNSGYRQQPSRGGSYAGHSGGGSSNRGGGESRHRGR